MNSKRLEIIIKLQAQIIDQYRNGEIFSDEQIKIINEALNHAKEDSYTEGYKDGLKNREKSND